jgi:hypothetical protein
MKSYSNWLIKILINGCFHIGPVICSRSASGHYSHPRAIITDLEHITICLDVTIKMNSKNTKLSEQFQNLIEKR